MPMKAFLKNSASALAIAAAVAFTDPGAAQAAGVEAGAGAGVVRVAVKCARDTVCRKQVGEEVAEVAARARASAAERLRKLAQKALEAGIEGLEVALALLGERNTYDDYRAEMERIEQLHNLELTMPVEVASRPPGV
ncbi:MAG: hypothetical protein GC150_03240 [Rhizobiales bacterium]|nr:hypothetical protein [Hyphomicrobiales bacterium]